MRRSLQKCVSLKPEWAKGHVRCGAALHGMEDYEGAIMAFQKALDMDPDDAVAKSSLSKAQKALKKLSSEVALLHPFILGSLLGLSCAATPS